MSRAIKFRAWWPDEKQMEYDFGHDLGRYLVNETELMQFTGLLDNQGEEIYEGDILRGYHAIVSDAPTYEVYWDRGGFVVRNDKGMRYNIGDVEYGDMEIIGNIYENPELLKKDGNA